MTPAADVCQFAKMLRAPSARVPSTLSGNPRAAAGTALLARVLDRDPDLLVEFDRDPIDGLRTERFEDAGGLVVGDVNTVSHP